MKVIGLPPIKAHLKQLNMLKSYFKIILRLASRNKLTSAFSVLSVAIGIASFMVVAVYVRKELSYDRFHDNPESLYRIITNVSSPEESFSNAQSTPILIPSITRQFPTIIAAIRLFKYRSEVVVVDKSTNTSYIEPNFLWADPEVFRVFTIPLIKGTPASLVNPKKVIISESTARKYFGNKDPIGKILNNVTFTEFEVTGVFKDFPGNSHFKADFICSLITLKDLWGEGTMNNWYNSFLYSYIKIPSPSDAVHVEQQLNLFLNQHIQLPAGNKIALALQPVTEIHLSSHLMNELDVNGNKMYIFILSAVGLLILIVSMINFVNLGIAKSAQRSKEIGVRKVLGSSRKIIFKQVITENLLYGLAAFLVSIGLIQIFLPYINTALGSEFRLTSMDYMSVAIGFFSVIVVVLITSLYPAIFMAGLKAVEVLKAKPVQLGKGINLWKGLIVFQMSITLFLLTACFVLNTQLNFLQSKPLGYETEHVLNIPLLTDSSQKNYQQFKRRLLQRSFVQSASATSHLIGGPLYQSGYTIFKSAQERSEFAWQRIHADYDYVKTNNLKIVAGRDFSETFLADSLNFIINEAAYKALGFQSPSQAIGLNIDRGQGQMGKIIGVISDFHFKSLQNFIEPLVIHYEPGRFRFLSVNIKNAGNAQNVINFIKSEWNRFEAGAPFIYFFPDEFTEKLYSFEKNLWLLITVFTIIAFILSIAGLVGLSYYVTRLKAKEIGIRKVLGASVQSILQLFSIDFLKMSLLAMTVGFPMAWWAMYNWLQDFAYRINLSWWQFAIAGIIVVVAVFVTISFQSIKAALTNPLKSLRTE